MKKIDKKKIVDNSIEMHTLMVVWNGELYRLFGLQNWAGYGPSRIHFLIQFGIAQGCDVTY